MSTRCAIACKNVDGTFTAIYCHHDGYVKNGVGEILLNYYNNEEVIRQLLDLGDLSALGTKPIPYWEEDLRKCFDSEKCLSYRMRGEKDVDARVFTDEDDVIDFYRDCDYFYFFIDGQWQYSTYSGSLHKLSI